MTDHSKFTSCAHGSEAAERLIIVFVVLFSVVLCSCLPAWYQKLLANNAENVWSKWTRMQTNK